MALLRAMAPDAPDGAVVDRDIKTDMTGIALLDLIAARFGMALPAVVITGGTSLEVLEELSESGHPWLIKPTDPLALRTALAERVARLRRF